MDILQQNPLTMTTTKAGAAAGTTTTLTTANTVLYAIKGKAFTKAGASNAATPTTDATTGAAYVAVPVNYGCAYVLGYDAAGTLKVSQGGLQALWLQSYFSSYRCPHWRRVQRRLWLQHPWSGT